MTDVGICVIGHMSTDCHIWWVKKNCMGKSPILPLTKSNKYIRSCQWVWLKIVLWLIYNHVYLGTIFAYGQTGTGKTYTMEGQWLILGTYASKAEALSAGSILLADSVHSWVG